MTVFFSKNISSFQTVDPKNWEKSIFPTNQPALSLMLSLVCLTSPCRSITLIVGMTISWLVVGGYGCLWPLFGWLWLVVTFFFGWVWMGVGGYAWLLFWLGVGRCGWVWPFFTGCGWLWVVVGECGLFCWVWLVLRMSDLFLAGCGWVWVSVTFFGWMCVGVGERDLFWLGVGECGWVWPFLGWVGVNVGGFG